ncbi:threonine ammonia-lyase, biosynthetic [Herbaspirillum sp. RTI4]|uniref:threonine ammonia-lyase, biosynthetic n=1 Tax=Herbaspirillum sp. RTI4 TaxID=3048640 RepID=UPI002AB58B4A|nr:threonine ammonia-lyase, biosynthetic [Herbaspirillum sp. RTI4]MDY7577859.1 threonine ammonia-lyase, biosynthetic [Herbaspirillum sp. RTI4]MEA9982477.1 threonine ammonia-lyase, biosynthetic [Herbaspirillum sp. RTI4]
MTIDYLKKILTSRVYDVAVETPLEFAKILSEKTGNRIYFKREDMQSVRSFKLRGAYNKMANLKPAQLKRGVICASAGNHAQGVALSAARLGCRAVIVMPVTTPSVKIEAVKALGGEVVLSGESFTDAYDHALTLEKKLKLTFVHPFDDPDVIAGQGTIAMEILRQHSGPIDAIFVAIGGGGLISGVAAYVKAVRPEIKIIGVQTTDSDAMARSLKAGRRITLTDVGLFADGTAVKLVGEETFRLAQKYVDEIILVDTDAVCTALKDVFQDTRSILEPSGALAVAGAKAYIERAKNSKKPVKNQTLVSIACGANMNFDRLRFVVEMAEVGESREVMFAVTIPEQRGSFRHFCELVGPRNVTEFNYRISDERAAHVFIGIQTDGTDDAKTLTNLFEKNKFNVLDLTRDELAKVHVRHMVGGKSALAEDELLYRFEFPERRGALMRFLNSMSPNWNISLFHYRSQGGDVARILVGLQIPKREMKGFKEFLAGLGYRYSDESNNPAYKLFLG